MDIIVKTNIDTQYVGIAWGDQCNHFTALVTVTILHIKSNIKHSYLLFSYNRICINVVYI